MNTNHQGRHWKHDVADALVEFAGSLAKRGAVRLARWLRERWLGR